VRRALIQPTKRGEIFVLDRVTGEPIKAVSELPVPQGGTVPEERLSPTQPFSTDMPSFRGATLREADMWGMTPIDQMMCRILFKQSRYEGDRRATLAGTPPGCRIGDTHDIPVGAKRSSIRRHRCRWQARLDHPAKHQTRRLRVAR
jgi:hypothetical protein